MNGPKPSYLMGNLGEFLKIGFTNYDKKLFTQYGKTVGYFEAFTLRPIVLTKDVNFIKKVLIKDFSSFVNRRVRLLGLNSAVVSMETFLKRMHAL